MKRILSLIVVLVLFPCLSLGEEATDYSWLDDMTINQLKELDAEIHKRIPASNEPSEETTDAETLLGLLFGAAASQEKNVEPASRALLPDSAPSQAAMPKKNFTWIRTAASMH